MATSNANTELTSVNRRAADEFQYKAHAEDGVYFLVDTNAAPVGLYYGFLVLADTIVSNITHINATKNGDVTTVTSFPAGFYCSQPGGFSTITLTSGEIQLLKYVDKQ